jgi:hypothetical protein
MPRVKANWLTYFWRMWTVKISMMVTVDLRKPLTFYDLLDIEFHYGQSEVSNSENAYF